MYFYITLLYGSVALVLLSQCINRKASTIAIGVVLVAMTAFAGLRGFVGTDTFAYYIKFQEFEGWRNPVLFVMTEPLFGFLMAAVNAFSDSFFLFLATVAIIQCFLLIKVLRSSHNAPWFLAVYIMTFYLNFHFNVIRAGTAALFMLLAFNTVYEKGLKFYLMVLFAVASHFSSGLVIPILFFLRGMRRYSMSAALGMTLASLAAVGIGIFAFPDALSWRVLPYMYDPEKALLTSGFGLVLRMGLILSLTLLAAEKGDWMEIVLISAMYIIVDNIALFYLSVLQRIGMFYEILFIFIICNSRNFVRRKAAISAMLLVFIALEAYGTVVKLASEPRLILEQISPYIPYRFFWQ